MGLWKTPGPDTWVKIVDRQVPAGRIECSTIWTVYQWAPPLRAIQALCRPLIVWLAAKLAEDGKRLLSVQARVEFTYRWTERKPK